jgi:GH43 family beta-xylosidase
MKTTSILFLLICFCVASHCQAQEANPLTGTWTIERAVIKKKVGSAAAVEKTYYSVKNMDSFVNGPEKIRFTADSVVFLYPESVYDRGLYTLKGDSIFAEMPDAPYRYRYSIVESGRLRIDYTTNYSIDGVKAGEVCYFIGHKD